MIQYARKHFFLRSIFLPLFIQITSLAVCGQERIEAYKVIHDVSYTQKESFGEWNDDNPQLHGGGVYRFWSIDYTGAPTTETVKQNDPPPGFKLSNKTEKTAEIFKPSYARKIYEDQLLGSIMTTFYRGYIYSGNISTYTEQFYYESPEPSSIAILGIGGFSVLVFSRYKKRWMQAQGHANKNKI